MKMVPALRVSAVERLLGIETFASETLGIGGVIKHTPEDFVVEEVLVDGSKAEVKPNPPTQLAGEGRYLACLLVKRNWDTLLAARRIAKQLGISERRIQIAGIKDKKALTAQHVSIENISLEKVKRLQINDIQLYPLRRSTNMVFPHMSFGNVFHLTVRGVSHSRRVIQERTSKTLDKLSTLGGVPNFFGHQRFGTIRPITHLVGKALARKDLEKAALIFLAQPSPHEHPQSRKARQTLSETRDFAKAARYFPQQLLYERLMLSHLARHPGDYAGAFRRLPPRLCSILLQSYQSYLFNRFLSQRLQRGIPINQPQVGDYAVKTDRYGLPTKTYVKASAENLEDLCEAVRKGSMYVALPLIGFKQTPSEGVEGEIEQAILKNELVTPTDFYISSMPEMSAPGEPRAAITPIIDLCVETPERDELNKGKKRLLVSFTLHRGCYATIILREFMKPRNLIKAGF
ncbi:MAG: tRNA pseudouridine(13) synthase TruD, partial [Candidatus Bathyarchaeia archaeon]